MPSCPWLAVGLKEAVSTVWASVSEELLVRKVHFSVRKGASLSCGSRGLVDQGLAAAAFSLSHQISQVEAKCLNIVSKLAGDKVFGKALIWPEQVQLGAGAGLPWKSSAA